ncbi:hypothetical protein SLA2020_452090 [Shorea laevis]
MYFLTVDLEKGVEAVNSSLVVHTGSLDLEKGVEAVNTSLVVHTGSLDLEKGVEAVNSSLVVHAGSLEGGAVLEPYVGMEFDTEDAARKFYVEYARRVGFVVRIMQRRRSGIDGRTLARRLGCNKQGFSPNQRGTVGPEKSHGLAHEKDARQLFW